MSKHSTWHVGFGLRKIMTTTTAKKMTVDLFAPNGFFRVNARGKINVLPPILTWFSRKHKTLCTQETDKITSRHYNMMHIDTFIVLEEEAPFLKGNTTSPNRDWMQYTTF